MIYRLTYTQFVPFPRVNCLVSWESVPQDAENMDCIVHVLVQWNYKICLRITRVSVADISAPKIRQ